MKRILIAFELGGNLGHLSRCIPIASALRDRGHQVMFAVRDTRSAAGLLPRYSLPFIQAPAPSNQARGARTLANYSEMLIDYGYGDTVGLTGLVSSWVELIRLFKADTLLVDHAPTALMASYVAGVPAIAIGNGFAIPPQTSPQPSIRPWENTPEERLIRADQQVNDAIGKVLTNLGASPISLTDLFKDISLLDTFPELDHFGPREGGNYIGPVYAAVPDAPSVRWQNSGEFKVLAYLRPEVGGFSSAVDALRQCSGEVIAVIPGVLPQQARALASKKMRISTAPLSLPELLPETDLMVSYGGTGTVAQTLLAGIPQLIAAWHIEQHIASLRVESMGAGLAIGKERSRDVFSNAIEKLIAVPKYKQAAADFSKNYAGVTVESSTMRVVTMLELAS